MRKNKILRKREGFYDSCGDGETLHQQIEDWLKNDSNSVCSFATAECKQKALQTELDVCVGLTRNI